MNQPGFKALLVYRKSFRLAMEIFTTSKSFPKEETYLLTDQIRRSSRSVNANLAEAYRKRQYPAHFLSKLSDSDAENSETQVWLDYAYACEYIPGATHVKLTEYSIEIGRLLSQMISYPEKYLLAELPKSK